MNKLLLPQAAFCLALLAAPVVSQAAQPVQNVSDKHHTEGFGAGKLLLFTYTQNYDCVEQPTDNLDFDHHNAAVDAEELQIPICQAGTEPTINPPGKLGPASATTDPLYVLVPMFSVDNDQNPNDAISCDQVTPGTLCGPDLGRALIGFFGALPEGFKAKPLVFTECPEPGSRPGACTMHASRVDLAPVLAALGYIGNPPTANVFVPTPNHSHVLDGEDIHKSAEWWQVRPVLVLKQKDWPPQDGSSGIVSATKLDNAEKAGRAIEAPSNFFLYFGSHVEAKGPLHH